MTDTPTVFIIHRCPCGKVVANKGDLCVAHGVEKAVRTAKVALLRELAAELTGQADARWSGWVYSASVAEDIAKMLTTKADALEKGTPP